MITHFEFTERFESYLKCSKHSKTETEELPAPFAKMDLLGSKIPLNTENEKRSDVWNSVEPLSSLELVLRRHAWRYGKDTDKLLVCRYSGAPNDCFL